MTLKTWKDEFYSKKPSKRMTKLEAVQHSLLKWMGLTRKNLRKHGLEITRDWGTFISDGDERLRIDTLSCALCVQFLDYLFQENECENCPLYTTLGNESCGQGQEYAPYTKWVSTYDPKPMIKALEKTLKMVEREMK